MQIAIAVDTWFQKRFNAIVHWVMWTFGVSKGFVRYSLLSFAAVAFLVDSDVFAGRRLHVLILSLRLLMSGVLMMTATHWRNVDDSAHASGQLGLGDRPSRFGFRLFWWGWLAVGFASALTSKQHWLYDAVNVLSTCCFLAAEYLYNTPPFPPERREKKLVMATENA